MSDRPAVAIDAARLAEIRSHALCQRKICQAAGDDVLDRLWLALVQAANELDPPDLCYLRPQVQRQVQCQKSAHGEPGGFDA